jgi:spore germination cell wall hydrolase CwlJ-like protein
MPLTDALIGLAAAFIAERELDLRPRPLACLALNAYHEARGQGTVALEAVAHVTLNRAEDSAFPDGVCEVVTDGCQFSWWCDGKGDAPADRRAFREALGASTAALLGSPDPTRGALYFLRAELSPEWTASLRETARIGDHRFLAP